MSVPSHLKERYSAIRQYKSQQFYTVQLGHNCLYLSYGVPIAAAINGKLYVTEAKYSVTTSKHTNMARRLELGLEIEKATPTKLDELSQLFAG